MLLIDARATPDDLLELGHGLNTLVQNDQLARLCINTRCQKLGCGSDDRIARFRVDEVVELGLAKRIVAGDPHSVPVIFSH